MHLPPPIATTRPALAWCRRAATLLALALPLALAIGGPAQAADDDTTFGEAELLAGRVVERADCDETRGRVWAAWGDTGACLRYWHAGSSGVPGPVLVYLTGDAISHGRAQPAYLKRSPQTMQALVETLARDLRVPFVLLARPGTYGSSGDHRQRRREAEAQLVSAALDRLRERLAVSRYTLVGFSGGGHVAALLLARRSDLDCVVLASAVSAPRLRWEALGQRRDITGFDDSVEPLALLGAPPPSPGLRVRIVGDPADSNTPWRTQTPIGQRLRALGVDVAEIEATGQGAERHDVSAAAMRVGADCGPRAAMR